MESDADVDENSFKTEPIDFDLLQFVQSAGDDDHLGEDMIDKLAMTLDEQKTIDTSTTDDLSNCPTVRNDNTDLLERAFDCPTSPFFKSEEIVDYVDDSSMISISSSSPVMEEPDWLSSWDSF